MPKNRTMTALKDTIRIVSFYCLFSVLWIYFSDTLLLLFIKDVELFAKIQTYKGIAFVIVTSLLIFSLVKTKLNQMEIIQKQFEENKQRLEYVIQGAHLGYWDWDYVTGDHQVNDIWLELLGLTRSDINNNIEDWSNLVHPDDRHIGLAAVEQTIKDHKTYTIEFRMRHKDGHWVWIEGSGAVVERDKKTKAPLRIAGTHKDINFRKIAQEKMNFLAFNDPLTSLPNRAFLKMTLEKFLQDEEIRDFAFLFLDLDYFKNINDSFGHTFGDQVIQDVASRFKNTLDKEDFIARVGGDEFVILTHNVLHVKELCQTLAHTIEQPFEIKKEVFSLGTSIGIALFPQDGDTFETLFKNADTAMYVAKSKGKNRYQFYTESMSDRIFKSTKMDIEMKRAIENDEFILHYQPKIDLATGVVVGAEALLRWQDPLKGMVTPATFIPRAEENRLMVPIGNVVIKKAFLQMKQWEKNPCFSGRLAINISSVQLEEEDFVTTLKSLLEETQILACNIELEVTESAIMKNEKQCIQTLQQLKNLGFSIAIDDFGTGYSSLNYIKALPIDTLKIDRTFVKDVPHDADDVAITLVIITLAKQLNLALVAEGIESEEQREFLFTNGCGTAQGFLFAPAMEACDFETFCQKTTTTS